MVFPDDEEAEGIDRRLIASVAEEVVGVCSAETGGGAARGLVIEVFADGPAAGLAMEMVVGPPGAGLAMALHERAILGEGEAGHRFDRKKARSATGQWSTALRISKILATWCNSGAANATVTLGFDLVKHRCYDLDHGSSMVEDTGTKHSQETGEEPLSKRLRVDNTSDPAEPLSSTILSSHEAANEAPGPPAAPAELLPQSGPKSLGQSVASSDHSSFRPHNEVLPQPVSRLGLKPGIPIMPPSLELVTGVKADLRARQGLVGQEEVGIIGYVGEEGNTAIEGIIKQR